MNSIKLKSRAKINLVLDVLKKREDGYHDLKMIMQTLSLCDNIYMSKIEQNKIIINTNHFYLPTDDKNIVYKTIDLLKNKYNITEGLHVFIDKQIPISAGLAGGSGNCAAALIGMNKLFNLKLKKIDLINIGKTLGADVPFCIVKGTALCEGIGDIITPLSPIKHCYVVVVNPKIKVSTAKVFKNLDISKLQKKINADLIIPNLDNLTMISKLLSNDLEQGVIKKYPIIEELKLAMLKTKALGSLMSGSGPTVFGIYASKKDALFSIKYIKKNFKNINPPFLTTTFNP